MAKRSKNKVSVPPEVHDWLSKNSKRSYGGQVTKRLIELGKKALGEEAPQEVEGLESMDDVRDAAQKAREQEINKRSGGKAA